MIRAIPVSETDESRLYREFFDPAFLSQRLGRSGHWEGAATQKLNLHDPVRHDDFQALLQARASDGASLLRRPPHEADRIGAWRITLSEDGPASVALWALAPAGYRAHLWEVHHQAVGAAMADFERGLNGRPWINNTEAPGRKSVLFAEFQAGATRQQSPRLHTNLFLFNLLFERGAPHRSLEPERVTPELGRLEAAYTAQFARGLRRILGDEIKMPHDLCLRFQGHPPQDGRQRQGLENRQLFAAWQQQAEGWGWGPERVGKLIVEARSRQTLSNWSQDLRKLLRLWTLSVRQREHSPLRVLSAMMEGHERKRNQAREHAARSQSHDQGMSH